VPLGSMGWRVKGWGSADLIHWFNYDPRPFSQRDAFIISEEGPGCGTAPRRLNQLDHR
jgi:hypothetical protein